jgi:hypothetical protein
MLATIGFIILFIIFQILLLTFKILGANKEDINELKQIFYEEFKR